MFNKLDSGAERNQGGPELASLYWVLPGRLMTVHSRGRDKYCPVPASAECVMAFIMAIIIIMGWDLRNGAF